MKFSTVLRPASLGVVAALSLTLMACGQDKDAKKPEATEQKTAAAEQTEQAKSAEGAAPSAGELIIHTAKGEQKIPANPTPLAVFDMTALQNLKALGVAVQGVPFAEMKPETIKALNLQLEGAAEPTTVGTLFEPNLEVLNGLKPQAVFIGGRASKKEAEIAKIAPTYNLTIDNAHEYEATKQQLTDFGTIFNKKVEADKLIADIDKAIADTKAAVQGKGNGLMILINGNKMSAYGKASRFGYLHTVFGVPMADETIKDDNPHGQAITFEYIQKVDPDWLFVLDRAAAIGEEGVSAEKVLDNPLIQNTKAWKNKHIVYLSPDSYMAFGGYYQWLKDTKIVTDAFNAK